MVSLLLLVSAAHAQSAEELITRMKGAWDSLRSYRSGQIIQERVRGDLGPAQQVRVAFRKPSEIQLEWSLMTCRSANPGPAVDHSFTRQSCAPLASSVPALLMATQLHSAAWACQEGPITHAPAP